jgi:hypothetical protein
MNKRLITFLSVISLFLFLTPNAVNAADSENPGISLPDDKTGYQIQMVYVETSSSLGSNYDTNGQIEQWVSQAQSWIKNQTGKELIFDTYQGKLDIAYLKFDGNIDQGNDEVLVQAYRTLNPNTYFGKTLAFVVDQTVSQEYMCGWAGQPSDYALIFPNLKDCGGFAQYTMLNNGLTYPAAALVHEIIHSYGVSHVCVNTTDLMQGSPECVEAGVVTDGSRPETFDESKTYYFGGDKAGVDLATLRIWSDGSGQRRPSLYQGTCWVGEICTFQEHTFGQQGTVQLQVKSGKKWSVVNTAKSRLSNCSDCLKYSYKNSHTFSKAGTYQYRIVKPAYKNYSTYFGPTEKIRVVF